MDNLKVRIRYSRLNTINRMPKNTLVTIGNNRRIYFGIARCNILAGDKFKRTGVSGGKTIAAKRLMKALEENNFNSCKYQNINMHPSGLRGYVYSEHIKDLIAFFNNIDNWSKEKFAPMSRVVKYTPIAQRPRLYMK